MTVTETDRVDLVHLARVAGERVDRARGELDDAAAARRIAVAALYDAGMSVRAIAAELGISPTVVQDARRAARG